MERLQRNLRSIRLSCQCRPVLQPDLAGCSWILVVRAILLSPPWKSDRALRWWRAHLHAAVGHLDDRGAHALAESWWSFGFLRSTCGGIDGAGSGKIGR